MQALLGGSTWQTRTAGLITSLTLFRLLIIGTTSLTDTEAYYASWARFPDWSYYDHPPLVAWMTWLATRLSNSAMVIRLGPVLCSVLFMLLVYRLSARFFTPRAGFIAAAGAGALPVFFFVGFLANPEAPLAPLLVLYLLLVDDLRHHDEAWRPLAAGAVLGAAFLAKYTALLAVPVTLLQVATSRELRRWLRRPSSYLGALVALAVAGPVILWNVQRGWPTLTLHFQERMGAPSLALLRTTAPRLLAGQIVLFNPLIFPALLAATALTLRRSLIDERYRFLAIASGLVLLILYPLMLLVGNSEPHWTMIGYVPLLIAIGGWLDENLERLPRALRWYTEVSASSSAIVLLACFAHSQSPALLKLLPGSAYPADLDPFNETLGWDDLRSAMLQQAVRLGPDAVVASNHNVVCGHLMVALDDRPRVYCPSPQRTAFDFVARRDPPARAPVLYVDTPRYQGHPAALLPGRSCTEVQTVNVVRGGRQVRSFRLQSCTPQEGLATKPSA